MTTPRTSISRYFIDRPIFAWVIALIIVLAGIVAIPSLPISRYPIIAPPSVMINASYPGASARTVEDSVTQIIEQNMTSIDNLLYMTSSSNSQGGVTVSLTFESGTDPDIAQVQVQNRVQAVTPLLPQIVQLQGVNVAKANNNFLMAIGFVSEDDSMTPLDIGDYLQSTLTDQISRLPGVGGVQMFGSKYAMRIWLDPGKLAAYALTPADVAQAVNGQNAQVSVGQLGAQPVAGKQEINATITSQGRLQTAEQFGAITLRVNTDGSVLRLRDVARVELGADNYNFAAQYGSADYPHGKPAAGMGVMLATNANALATVQGVTDLLKSLEPAFPHGLKAFYPYDTTPFVRASIHEVVKTLLEAVGLVLLVMYLFLQSWRATLIPTIAVPVVLLGTFVVLAAFGYSINMLTMFAVVLAIGLLVDDAIVVVENVERLINEEHLSPIEATRRSMDQITGALVGIATVLAAVFIPMAFLSGSTGVIYRQFSVTIVSAMVLSVIVAIVLTPALCASLLKAQAPEEHTMGFFGWFNRFFARNSRRYQGAVRRILARTGVTMAVYLALALVMGWMFLRLPTAFLPDEDQGYLFTQVQTPVGSTTTRTREALNQVQGFFLGTPGVKSIFTIAGYSFTGATQNSGMGFVLLKDWEERRKAEEGVQAIAGRGMGALFMIKDAMAFAFAPPPVTELGNSTGFDFYLKDNASQGHDALLGARNQLLGMAAQSRLLAYVRPNGEEDAPQFRLDIDRDKVGALGLSMADVNQTLSLAWGGRYIDDFIDRGRVKRVYLQADAPYRMVPEDFSRWFVRNRAGSMVPVLGLCHFALGVRTAIPAALQRRGRDEHRRPVRAGRQLGRGDEGDRAPREEAAARLQHRLDRPVLPGTRGRCAGAHAVHAVTDRRVPVPRGAVRELGDSHRHPAGRAAGHHRRDPGHRCARHDARHLLPGGDADHRGPVEQECHPDRRVREGVRRAGSRPHRSDAARRA